MQRRRVQRPIYVNNLLGKYTIPPFELPIKTHPHAIPHCMYSILFSPASIIYKPYWIYTDDCLITSTTYCLHAYTFRDHTKLIDLALIRSWALQIVFGGSFMYIYPPQ